MQANYLFMTTVLALSLSAAGFAEAQISSSNNANVRGNVSVGGETSRNTPAIDQKIAPINDPVLDSRGSGAVQTDTQRLQNSQKDKMRSMDSNGRMAPVEGGRSTVTNNPSASPSRLGDFGTIDRNGNGEISRAEFDAVGNSSPFATLDTDGNGSLSPAELSTYNQTRVK